MLLEARESVMRIYRPIFIGSNISELQWRILRIVVEVGTLSASEVVERSHISMPNLSRALRDLEDASWVTREIFPQDRRRIIISPTAEGKALHAKIFPKIIERNLLFEKWLTIQKKDELYSILQYLMDVSSEVSDAELDEVKKK